MKDLESNKACADTIQGSFKVIGIGNETADIIEKVKSFGFECVDCLVTESLSDCIPTDNDKLAIIVAQDHEDAANKIANAYHVAGVLTIGLVNNADFSCYDNITTDTEPGNYPEIIKSLLQPLTSQGYIHYDFYDLSLALRDFRFFRTFVADGKNVEEAVINTQKKLANVTIKNIESLSIHLYSNRDKQPAIMIDELSYLSNMISNLPKSTNVIWSMNYDNTLPKDIIRLTTIISGKELLRN